MKRVIGFMLIWIAVGMIIMMFINNWFLSILIILLCLVLGYNLFTSC